MIAGLTRLFKLCKGKLIAGLGGKGAGILQNKVLIAREEDSTHLAYNTQAFLCY